MIYYFSAPTTPSYCTPILRDKGVKHYLMSFAVDAYKIKEFAQPDDVMMIDSGAFTAWTKGKKIDVNEYLKFCQSLPEHYIFINLDVIPPTGCTRKDIEMCCQEGYENFLFLSKHLKNVLPVYHYRERIEWLIQYLQHTDYIGLSPSQDTEEDVKIRFFDYCFNALPLDTRTHGFGYASPDGIKKFPFHSIDSTSWKASARFGTVTYFKEREKRFFTLDFQQYAELTGLPYNKLMPVSKDFVYMACLQSVESILKMMNWLAERNKTRDFSYIKSQQTLFE